MNAIETERLTKFYGKSRGIEDLTLAVAEGDFFGFIGPNGAGKSTTIRTLLGLISPTGGSAKLFGKNVHEDRTALLSRIGYLPAEAALYSGMRVRELLRFSAELRKKDCHEEAKRLCDRLELDGSKKLEELSLGNRKKAAIVCALQHKPELYILDEPTSGLDPLMQREFYLLLQERNEEGATVFLSSHVLSEVQRYCRKTGIIREGRLLACDSVANLGHTGAKRVTLRGVGEVPALAGVKDPSPVPDGISFLYSGDLHALMQSLAGLELTDIAITEPDLEEIFLHYYEKGGEGHDDL